MLHTEPDVRNFTNQTNSMPIVVTRYQKYAESRDSSRKSAPTPAPTMQGMPMVLQVAKRHCTVGDTEMLPKTTGSTEDTVEMIEMIAIRCTVQINSTPNIRENVPQQRGVGAKAMSGAEHETSAEQETEK